MSTAAAPQSVIDLRSDTVTRPTPAMRRAMAEAEVGDDVYAEDPTVNRLQARAAEIFGREAALFFPSGSMANLTAIKTWTRPGMEVICEAQAHIYLYEMAGSRRHCGLHAEYGSGSQRHAYVGSDRAADSPAHLLPLADRARSNLKTRTTCTAAPSIRPRSPTTSASAPTPPDFPCISTARAFSTLRSRSGAASRTSPRKFDSVMFCLSKGLGAPVGSMLVGSRDFIDKARVTRKLLGGGMRQAGVLAAAGLIALEETPKILHRDHENARHLAEGLAKIPGISIDPKKVVTNILIFDVSRLWPDRR